MRDWEEEGKRFEVLNRWRRRKNDYRSIFKIQNHKINKTESKLKRFRRFWPKPPIKTQVAFEFHLLRVLRALTNSNGVNPWNFEAFCSRCWNPNKKKPLKNHKELQDSQRNQTEVNPWSFVPKDTGEEQEFETMEESQDLHRFRFVHKRFDSGFMFRTNRWSFVPRFCVILGGFNNLG